MATRTSREAWELRVKRWVRSGLTAGEFAAGEALSSQSLVWWRGKLRRDGALDAREKQSGSARPKQSMIAH